MTMFGVLYLERDPLRLADVPAGLAHWVQVAGALAAIALVFWVPVRLVRGAVDRTPARPWLPAVFNSLLALAALGYLALLVVRMPEILAALGGEPPASGQNPGRVYWGRVCLTFAGTCALLAV